MSKVVKRTFSLKEEQAAFIDAKLVGTHPAARSFAKGYEACKDAK